ncbi:threonine synthase [soil metagenome]
MPGIMLRYGEYLPLTAATPLLSLREGSTPLQPAPRLARWIGVTELFLKVEGLNPTGSFKDRGMVVAVARALEDGARAVLCASTGNTAASAAAYAAHAGIEAIVLLPEGKVAAGKLAQAVTYGARVVTVSGNFDDALDLARDAAAQYDVALVNSVNPFRIEGQTTGAYEICDELGDAPELLALPVGNGGNISAYWLGFQRAVDHGRSQRLPRMLGVQALGAAPLVLGHPVSQPETVATAIRIGNPATWQPAVDAADHSGGEIRAVSDDAILEAYHAIARMEGVFCEPASAAGVAGLRAAVRAGVIAADTSCVCVLTGNGLKDPDTAIRAGTHGLHVEPDLSRLASALGWS